MLGRDGKMSKIKTKYYYIFPNLYICCPHKQNTHLPPNPIHSVGEYFPPPKFRRGEIKTNMLA
jgi:hypothetical protein